MIGRLRGELLEKLDSTCLVDINGIGYEVEISLTTFAGLPEIGSQVVLHTHFVVREDAQLLYGFINKQERRVFKSLIRVNGVGPKLALTLLSGMMASEFVECVQEGDVQTLVRVPGIGKKTAERLILEMRDRLDEWAVVDTKLDDGAGSSRAMARETARDAETALISLGYKPQDAAKAISQVQGKDLELSALIKEALKKIG